MVGLHLTGLQRDGRRLFIRFLSHLAFHAQKHEERQAFLKMSSRSDVNKIEVFVQYVEDLLNREHTLNCIIMVQCVVHKVPYFLK